MHGHQIKNQNALHYLTFTVVGWVDVFTRVDYKKVLIDSLLFCQKEKGLNLNAYVIMSNHIHLIASAKENYQLSAIIRDFKRHTSKTIIKMILEEKKESRQEWMLRLFKYYAKYNKNNMLYQFWQNTNHPVELVSPKWINEKLNYIHNNPTRAELVLDAAHYMYSSASNYVSGKGVLGVTVIDLGLTDGQFAV